MRSAGLAKSDSCGRARRRTAGIVSVAMAAAMLILSACSSTQVYNWKPQAGGAATQPAKAAKLKPGSEITPASILDEGAPENQPMWVAVPAGRDGSIVWVQTRRTAAPKR